MFSISFLTNIDLLWRLALVQFFILFLFLMNFTSFSYALSFDIKPFFFLMAIFYWGIYRPTITPLFFIFILGLVQDLVLEYPVGLHSILYISLFMLVRYQRLFLMGQAYHILWLFFGLFCAGYALLQWLFFSLRYLQFFDFTSLLYSVFITIFLYPLINGIFILLHRMVSSVSPLDN
jgi:rod shape-determining protein MreD